MPCWRGGCVPHRRQMADVRLLIIGWLEVLFVYVLFTRSFWRDEDVRSSANSVAKD